MPRQMLVTNETGAQILRESLAHNEAQLQQLLKDNPGLLPLDDLGLLGPALVVGKETSVPSGAIDLVLVARGGELVLVEFKTGPQNPDFRAALAQLLDYGSDLWQMTYDEFERTVAARFFASPGARGSIYEGCKTLDDAISKAWADDPLSVEEVAIFSERLTGDLADGAFTYVVAAQRLTDGMVTTARYLNRTHRRSRFCLVEVVRFTGPAGEEVFEARTVLRPEPGTPRSPSTSRLTREALMDQLGATPYADVIGRLLDEAEANGLHVEWGKTGVSIRVRSDLGGPWASVGWFFPPGVVGWQGLTDLVLGFDRTSSGYPLAKERIDDFSAGIEALGGTPVASSALHAWRLDPSLTSAHIDEIIQALETLGPSRD